VLKRIAVSDLIRGAYIHSPSGSWLQHLCWKNRVKVFFYHLLRQPIPVEIVDLARPGSNDRILAREPTGKWPSRNIDVFTVELPLGNRS